MRTVIAAGVLMLAATGAQAAGGAYAVDDSAIGAPGECQVESWASFASNGDFIGVAQPACVLRFGGTPVEITAALSGVRGDDAWSAVTGLQAKVILVALEPGNVGVALSVGMLADLTRGDSLAYVNVPVTVRLLEQLKININAGALWAEDLHFTWGAGFEWEFRPAWSLLAEAFGQSGSSSDVRAQAGLRYTPVKSLDLDLIYGHNIAGENARWITAGVTKRF